MAVAKVEELTRQLEELRRGRSARDQPPASALELDKLRRELMVGNIVVGLRVIFEEWHRCKLSALFPQF